MSVRDEALDESLIRQHTASPLSIAAAFNISPQGPSTVVKDMSLTDLYGIIAKKCQTDNFDHTACKALPFTNISGHAEGS